MSTCPKCPNTSFEMKDLAVRGSRFKLMSIQCSVCGAVVGVMEHANIGVTLQKQNRALEKMARQLGVSVDLD